jgi:hypothetical protein
LYSGRAAQVPTRFIFSHRLQKLRKKSRCQRDIPPDACALNTRQKIPKAAKRKKGSCRLGRSIRPRQRPDMKKVRSIGSPMGADGPQGAHQRKKTQRVQWAGQSRHNSLCLAKRGQVLGRRAALHLCSLHAQKPRLIIPVLSAVLHCATLPGPLRPLPAQPGTAKQPLTAGGGI